MNISELSAPLITLNQNLNPNIWDGSEQLRPQIKDRLTSVVENFVSDMGLPLVEDAVLVGSHAGFSWNPQSTLIVAVMAPIGDDDIYKELLSERISEWQLQNQIKVEGYPLTITVVDSSVDNVTGSYSLMENRWKTVPKRRAFVSDDVPVLALLESWSQRISKQNFDGWIAEWRQFNEGHQDGSVEKIVAESLNDIVVRRDREVMSSFVPQPKKKDFIYGYHDELVEDSSFSRYYSFLQTLRAPNLPLIESSKRNIDDFVKGCDKHMGQWIWDRTKVMNENGVSFSSLYGVNSGEFSHNFKVRQTKLHFPQMFTESKEISVEDLKHHLLLNLRNDEPNDGEKIDLITFNIIESYPRFTVGLEKIKVDGSQKQRDGGSVIKSDGNFYHVGSLDSGGSEEVVGWCKEGEGDKFLSWLMLSSDQVSHGWVFRGWEWNQEQDSVSKIYNKMFEDAEPTPDGVNPTTCMFLNEKEVTPKADIVREFFRLCVKSLQIEKPPRVQLRRDPKWSARNKTFGRYDPQNNSMELSLANRNVMDICRTLCHELVHCRQNERGELGPDSGRDGSPQENEANSLAGEIMRKWGKLHPEFFEAENIGESSGYIPTEKQKNDPRWEMALTNDVRPGATGKEANKLSLVTDRQGHPQIARTNGKFESQLAESWQKFKESSDEIPDWLIDLYDRSIRADYAAGRGASPSDKKRATFASKALVKGLTKFWGEDGYRHGHELAMAHKARHGWDDLDDYLAGEHLEEGANDDYLWQARVKIKQAKYVGYIPVTVSAPDMRRARTLIASMYGVKDSDIGSTTKVKRK